MNAPAEKAVRLTSLSHGGGCALGTQQEVIAQLELRLVDDDARAGLPWNARCGRVRRRLFHFRRRTLHLLHGALLIPLHPPQSRRKFGGRLRQLIDDRLHLPA